MSKQHKVLLCIPAVFFLWFFAIVIIPLPNRLSEPGSPTVYYEDGRVAHTFLSPDDRWRISINLDDIDPNYINALIAIEDKRFWWHIGFDPIAVLRATAQNVFHGEVVSGASTITMQLIRVLEPRKRTIFSKMIEAFRASQLEYYYSKDEILSFYLTFVPYGKNIEGVEAASILYFGHRANHLDSREISTLISVPQNPNSRFPSPQNHDRLLWSRDHIGHLLDSKGLLPYSEAQNFSDVFAHPPPLALKDFPRDAMHASFWLRGKTPEAERIKTHLNLELQSQIEQLVSLNMDDLKQKDIHHISVIVVDNKSAEVKALVGGFDFFDKHTGSQIPSFTIPRNCGSTLKPFLYAYALDSGTVLPSTLIRDIPEQYGGYTPRNFYGRYEGLVPLEVALVRSLNAPFIRLLSDVGFGEFASLLLRMGGDSIESRIQDYGLSIMLGAELTPLELAEMYSTFGNNGVHKPLSITEFDDLDVEEYLFSPASVWLTEQTLKRRDRPDFPTQSINSSSSRPMAWKTGTSVGFRDAWSAGWYGDYTVVVWVGNLDFRSSIELVGAQSAAPIFFDVIDALPKQAQTEKPEDIVDVRVCRFSGSLSHSFCSTTSTKGIVDRIPTKECPYHQEYEVSNVTQKRVFPGCREGISTHRRRYLVFPSAVQRWIPGEVEPLPEISPNCEPHYLSHPNADNLRVLSPYSGQISILLKGVPANKQPVSFWADYPDPSAILKWYVGDNLVATEPAGTVAYWAPVVGKHLLKVKDNFGNEATRMITVSSP